MSRYTLTNERGDVVSARSRTLPGTDLQAEEYGLGRAAGEMYRDAMCAVGNENARAKGWNAK